MLEHIPESIKRMVAELAAMHPDTQTLWIWNPNTYIVDSVTFFIPVGEGEAHIPLVQIAVDGTWLESDAAECLAWARPITEQRINAFIEKGILNVPRSQTAYN